MSPERPAPRLEDIEKDVRARLERLGIVNPSSDGPDDQERLSVAWDRFARHRSARRRRRLRFRAGVLAAAVGLVASGALWITAAEGHHEPHRPGTPGHHATSTP